MCCFSKHFQNATRNISSHSQTIIMIHNQQHYLNVDYVVILECILPSHLAVIFHLGYLPICIIDHQKGSMSQLHVKQDQNVVSMSILLVVAHLISDGTKLKQTTQTYWSSGL